MLVGACLAGGDAAAGVSSSATGQLLLHTMSAKPMQLVTMRML